MLRIKIQPLISTTNRKARVEFAKASRVLWTDETKINLYLSDGKRKCGEKKKLQMIAYSLICKAWWRWCYGMGIHGCLWNRPLNFNDDLMYDDSGRNEFGRVQNHLGYQYSRKCHQTHQKALHIASRTMTQTHSDCTQGICNKIIAFKSFTSALCQVHNCNDFKARFFTRRQVLINHRQIPPKSEANRCSFTRVTITQCELSKTRSEGIANARGNIGMLNIWSCR